METSKSMLQKFKRNVLGVGQGVKEKTVDTRYDTAKANWMKLNQIVNDLKSFATNYVSSAKGLFSNGGLVSDTFNVVFANQTHPYTKVSNDHKACMDTLNKDKARELEIRFEAGAGLKLNELTTKFSQYKTRIDQREELRSKQDYYNAKISKLRSERDKRLSSGHSEAAKDTQKREENEKKLEHARLAFETENNALCTELTHLWDHRLDLLGPVMVEFMLIQSTVARLLGDASRVSDASLSTVGAAKIPSWESLMNFTATEHKVSSMHSAGNDSDSDDEGHMKHHTIAAATAPVPPTIPVQAVPPTVTRPPTTTATPPPATRTIPPQAVRPAGVATGKPVPGTTAGTAPPPPPPLPATRAPPLPSAPAPALPPLPTQPATPPIAAYPTQPANTDYATPVQPAATAPSAPAANPFDWGAEF